MRVDLLKHNQEAYEKIMETIADGKKKIAVSHATGTGKSYLIAKLFEDYNNDKKLVLVPSTYISDQIQSLFEKYSIQNVDVILYQKLINMSDEDIAVMDYSVIALDEYHHDTSKVWGNKVRTLIDTHPETIICGTSATPIRSDGVNTIDELFEGNCASDLPLSEGIAKKIVPLPKYVGALYKLDDELERLRKKVEQATNTKEEKQEFYKKIDLMRSQIEKSYGMPIILNKHIKNKKGKYLVFCKNKRHLREIKETVIGWFRTAGCKGINAYEVYSDYENKDAEYKAFCDDTSHNLKLMFCIAVLNEGLHLENISGVLLLRPTRSSIVWHQQIGRAIEANNTNMPVIIDAVNNFRSAGQGMKLFKEIRDAVEREKKSNPNFEDSRFEDIDTFFVIDQILEVQEMFREIEGRLTGSWDLYIKALKQYKEREGDCLVPQKHIEIVDGINVSLGRWCLNIRNTKNNTGKMRLTKEMEDQLNQINFIWNTEKYKFERRINEIMDYYEQYGKYPSINETLGRFIDCEKSSMRNGDYPQWKMQIIKKVFPNFSYSTKSDKAFDMFINYAKMYKEKYGHLYFKCNDSIDGYNIGKKFSNIINSYKNKQLLDDKIRQLEEIGICLKDRYLKQFDEKMELAKSAVKECIVINVKNQYYKEINLYTWIISTISKKYKNNELSIEEIAIIESLIDKPLCKMFNRKGSFIKVVDVNENKKIAIYRSQQDLISDIRARFNMKITHSNIFNRLNGTCKSPYKGRFMFYYATDEEIKRYFENDKAS